VQGLEIHNWLGLIENAKEYNKFKPNPGYTFYFDELKRIGE
jgi:hypothetical protein